MPRGTTSPLAAVLGERSRFGFSSADTGSTWTFAVLRAGSVR